MPVGTMFHKIAKNNYLKVLALCVFILTGCGESDRYPSAQACGKGEYMMERGEGFSNKEWNNWCDTYGVSK